MIDAATRALVRDRAGNRCEYCRVGQRDMPFSPFHVDHIVPRKHGGDDNPDNLALSCDRCNVSKGPNLTGLDPSTGEVVKLFNPRTQSWAEHFSLSDATIVGLTPEGRTTVRVLNMNQERRVRLRSLLDRPEGDQEMRSQ